MKLPLCRFKPSPDTGSVVVIDANNDCVCICDDAEMADAIVTRLNATAAPEVRPNISDAARLKWLEDQNTLHKRVEILYVVDGYEVQVMHEDGVTELSPSFRGATLGYAIDAAIRALPQRVPE